MELTEKGSDPREKQSRPSKLSRREGRWVLVILFLALTVRVVYLLQAGEHFFFNEFSDSRYYHWWAQRIIQGQPSPPVYYMGPLYPHLLAFFYRIFGPRPQIVLWFQVLLGTASCGLIYLFGRMVFGSTVGLLAAAIGALYSVEIFYESALLMTTTLYALNLLLLISILWALERSNWFVWIIPGILLGFSSLGRANVLSFLPFLILGIFLLARGQPRGRIRSIPSILALLLGLLLVLAPVAARNKVVGRDLVLITSNLGLNLFVGNNPDASGYYQQPQGLDLSSDLYGAKIAMVFEGHELKPSEVSRFWLRKALTFVREHPGAFLRLTVNKFLFFWNAYEIPQVEHLDFFKRFAPTLRWPLLSFSLVGPLGLLGLALSLRRWRLSYFPMTFIFSLMVATVFFFVISRLRLQICSVLMVFAAYALTWLWERLRAKQTKQLVAALLALVPLVLLVNWPHPALSAARDLAKSHNVLALHLWNQGDLEGAGREYENAIALYPLLGETYVNLGNLRFEQGRPDETLKLYDRALQADPRVSSVHLNLGNIYSLKGRWDEAIREYRAEIKSHPYNLKAYEGLHKALQEREKLRKGQPSEE
jgi:tetratricopeptide (TPR) repeat protein